MVYTSSFGLAIADTLSNGLLTSSPPDSSTVDTDSLLVLVSESAGLVWASWSEENSYYCDVILNSYTVQFKCE